MVYICRTIIFQQLNRMTMCVNCLRSKMQTWRCLFSVPAFFPFPSSVHSYFHHNQFTISLLKSSSFRFTPCWISASSGSSNFCISKLNCSNSFKGMKGLKCGWKEGTREEEKKIVNFISYTLYYRNPKTHLIYPQLLN